MSDASEREARRMDAVRRYDILDSPPDGAFDRLTALTARVCNTPAAVVTIVDSDRIWFKSHHGLDVDQIGRDPGLCASAILQEQPWIVEDASVDPRTLANPLVSGDVGLRFYLGVPLTTSDGHNLGTLCALDFEPREATDREIADITDLAAVVVDELELRLAARRVVAGEKAQHQRAEEIARLVQDGLLPRSLPKVDGVDLGAQYLPANLERVGGDFYEAVATETGFVLLIGDVAGHGPEAAAVTSMARHTMLALATGDWSPAQSLTSLSRAMYLTQIDEAEPRFCTVAAVRVDRDGSKWTATVSLGGHPHPWLIRTDGTSCELGAPGPLLGWLGDTTHTDVVVELRAGDILVLHTDGLTDTPPGTPSLAPDELVRVVTDNAAESASAIASALVAAVASREPAPRDDIAVLVAHLI